MIRSTQMKNEKGGGPGRPASLFSPLGESGQSDGGRLAGRVLACLYNPGILKKVPEKRKINGRIAGEISAVGKIRRLMPPPSHLSPDNILRFLQVRSEPASASEIAQGLHLKKTDNRPLFNMLSKLRKRGAIEELPGGRYRLPSRKSEREAPGQKLPQDVMRGAQPSGLADRDEIKGRLVLHHDGYGFVVPDSPMPQLDGDVFIPRDGIQDAMHGDHVLAKIQRLGGVTGAQRAEGRIIRILGRAHPTVVGLFRYGPQQNVVLPYDVRIQHEVEIPRGSELTPGLWKKLGFSGADETSLRLRRIPRLDELDGAVVDVELLRYPH